MTKHRDVTKEPKPKRRGRPPKGNRALSAAERQRDLRERAKLRRINESGVVAWLVIWADKAGELDSLSVRELAWTERLVGPAESAGPVRREALERLATCKARRKAKGLDRDET